jgi:3-hydroxyacyl-CoA dehydrogenase
MACPFPTDRNVCPPGARISVFFLPCLNFSGWANSAEEAGAIELSQVAAPILGDTLIRHGWLLKRLQPTISSVFMLIHSPAEGYFVNDAAPVHSEENRRALGRPSSESRGRLRALAAWKWREVERMIPNPPPVLRKVGIVGAGVMGRAIAEVHLRSGLPVLMTDSSSDALAAAKRALSGERFHTTASVSDFSDCDLVLETIPEVAAVKLELYRRLEPALCNQTLLATNTSTIPLRRLLGGLQRPERFCGIHFCHPVQERPLIEIIHSTQTSEETLRRAVAHARRLQMLPIVVSDGPGFLINRLLFPYLAEALELACDGVELEEIEAAAEAFGMAKGPFRLMDEIGLDTLLHGAWVLSSAFGERIPHSPLLVAMVKAGRTGCKAGRGFWNYDMEQVANRSVGQVGNLSDAQQSHVGRVPNRPHFRLPVAEEVRSLTAPWVRASQPLCREDLQARLLLPMLLEAFRILEEGYVRDRRDIELVVLFGLGFPQHCGGLFAWAEQFGGTRIEELLQSWREQGPRFLPPQNLLDWAVQERQVLSPSAMPPLPVDYPFVSDGHGWMSSP